MDLTVVLRIEAKDEFAGLDDGSPGWLDMSRPGYEPQAAEVQRHLSDLLADQTKHDERIGWRVTAVIAG